MGGGPWKEHLLITLTTPEPTAEIEKLKKRFPGIEIVFRQAGNGEIEKELYKPATILFTRFELPPNPHVDAPHLSYVHFDIAGVNSAANHPIYTHTSIPLTTANGVHGPQIAELLTMTRLAATQSFTTAYENQKRHNWSRRPFEANKLRDYRDSVGQRVGILGYGSIGRQAGRVASALGATVVAYTASPKDTLGKKRDTGYIVPGTGDPEGAIPTEWYSGTSKEALHKFLGAGLDWLIISMPLTDKTRGLIGNSELEVLGKRKAFLSNISRGDIVDHGALIEALKGKDKGGKGLLGGAALDVASPEPLPPNSELWDLPNVIITPHIGGYSANYEERCFEILSINLERRAKGEKLLNEVDRKRGY